VLTRLDHAEMARLYAETDVVLKLSRVEGMFGPPLEGFHLGATCVVSPVTGHDEYVEHGFNGVVVDWDDVKGAGRWLDVLARDRRLLHHLRSNALETARGWPSWEQSGQFMAAALREIRRRPPPRVGDGIALFAADVRAGAEEARMQIHRREKRIAALEIERDDLRARAEDATGRYEELRATQAYRVGLRLRRLTAPVRLAKRVRRRRAR
jgi:hypothetical protein